jgi:uncharacterized membrane protein YccF (DUF307 family)
LFDGAVIFFTLPLLFVFSFVCSIFALLIINLLIMKLLGNILWLLFGGLECALGYFAGSLALMITIIGIPFGIQTFKLGILCLWPFGSQVRENPESNGCLSLVMNIFWLIFGGLATCVGHLLFGLLLCVTIVGVPFGMQHFKMAKFALWPFGREISTVL